MINPPKYVNRLRTLDTKQLLLKMLKYVNNTYLLVTV